MSDTTTAADRRAVLIVGAALGALTGVGAAYLYLQSLQRRGEKVTLKAGDGLKLGLLLLGLMRSVAQLGEKG